jgi:hypothetical protein
MKCQLKTNMILEGKFVPVHTILDNAQVPENLRNEKYLNYGEPDKVLLLRQLNWHVERY